MNTYKVYFLCLVIYFSIFSLYGCGDIFKDEDEDAENMVCLHGERESHYTGENCMSCHTAGGEGEGNFSVAGSVYKKDQSTTLINSTVIFYTQPEGKGEKILTLEVDGLGNFYTTNALDLSNGLYPSLLSPNGETQHMSTKTTTGQCTSCHGTSTDRIWGNN
jgi:hypothetical protein